MDQEQQEFQRRQSAWVNMIHSGNQSGQLPDIPEEYSNDEEFFAAWRAIQVIVEFVFKRTSHAG